MFKQTALINNLLPKGGIVLHLNWGRNLNVINNMDNLSSLVLLETSSLPPNNRFIKY